MKTNIYGQGILTAHDLRTMLLQGKSIDNINVASNDEDIELYQQFHDTVLGGEPTLLQEPTELLSYDVFHTDCGQQWLFPIEYQTIDVYQWLIAKCSSDAEIDRVNEEYILYEARNLVMLLRLFIFLVGYMRENKFIWGVGRGSSVASYCLYLIGIHHVNSLYYGLDINEYLK